MRKKIIACFLILLFLSPSCLFGIVDSRDTNRFMYGFQRLVFSAFQLPFQVVQGTLNGPIGLGTVQGVLVGATQTVTNIVGGVFDMAAASAPYAKYAVFAL